MNQISNISISLAKVMMYMYPRLDPSSLWSRKLNISQLNEKSLYMYIILRSWHYLSLQVQNLHTRPQLHFVMCATKTPSLTRRTVEIVFQILIPEILSQYSWSYDRLLNYPTDSWSHQCCSEGVFFGQWHWFKASSSDPQQWEPCTGCCTSSQMEWYSSTYCDAQQ